MLWPCLPKSLDALKFWHESMNRLARLIGRRPTLFAARRIPLATPRIRRYASDSNSNSHPDSPESLYAEYVETLKSRGASLLPPPSPVSFEVFKQTIEEASLWDASTIPEPADPEDFDFEEFESESPNATELEGGDSMLPFSEEHSDTEEFDFEGGSPDPADLEAGSRGGDPMLEKYDAMLAAIEALEVSNDSDLDMEAELIASSSGGSGDPMLDKYNDMSATLEELEAASSSDLNKMQAELEAGLEDPSPDPVFEQRLARLDVENGPEWEVGQRVAQLVLSTTDKWRLEQIEYKLATYNGPLSRLNIQVEWYLQHPEEIDVDKKEENEGEAEEQSHELVQEEGRPVYDNNAYYYQKTPVDELVAHLQNREVQYVIKERMEWQDRDDLFKLLDSIIVPVFKEDMTVLNKIADIFCKYEDIGLAYTTLPRLPRIRRLDVFKRLLPEPDDEGPSEAEENAEIASIVEETKRSLEMAEAEKNAKREQWPNLMTRDPILDSREVLELPPSKEIPFHNRVVIRNHHSIFTEALEADSFDFKNHEPTKTDDIEEQDKSAGLELPDATQLRITTVLSRFARLQTSKGNKDRSVKVVLVGDGKGMLGLGFGKHKEPEVAHRKGLSDALRNLDWVERFEDRTIWTEVRTKFGATVVILRPRPVGFGLRCNPYIHRLLKAAGIKDISAKVWGSRNRVAVLKATMRLLHAGHAPLGMGDGVGGPGRKAFKGTGLRNKTQVERARGRRLIDLRV
ncbi:hypothetical protein DFH07DRAFT_512669 [Mycena maculata]|uniref:S5 DRBM domain-containing protein n=1 Tax=Mycena maculata TaxID=230809 RepID=A0AAD7IZ11_9AGAR|nr:hypothetical protein DFH07DRAFT_512669 [Mycena maculata]